MDKIYYCTILLWVLFILWAQPLPISDVLLHGLQHLFFNLFSSKFHLVFYDDVNHLSFEWFYFLKRQQHYGTQFKNNKTLRVII